MTSAGIVRDGGVERVYTSDEGLPPIDFAGTARLILDTAINDAIGKPTDLQVDRLVNASSSFARSSRNVGVL
jgi:hypothetical protein